MEVPFPLPSKVQLCLGQLSSRVNLEVGSHLSGQSVDGSRQIDTPSLATIVAGRPKILQWMRLWVKIKPGIESLIPFTRFPFCAILGLTYCGWTKYFTDDSPVNTNKQWFPMVSKWCRISSIHSMFDPQPCAQRRVTL